MAREGDNHWALLTQEEFSPPWKFRSFRFPCIYSFPLWFLDHVIFTLIHFSPVVTVEKIVGHNLVKAGTGSETPTEPCKHLMLFFNIVFANELLILSNHKFNCSEDIPQNTVFKTYFLLRNIYSMGLYYLLFYEEFLYNKLLSHTLHHLLLILTP